MLGLHLAAAAEELLRRSGAHKMIGRESTSVKQASKVVSKVGKTT
jgi:hypothetical protein